MEKRHNIAHVLRRRLSTEVDSAAKVEDAALLLLDDIVKFSFADAAVVDDICSIERRRYRGVFGRFLLYCNKYYRGGE